MQAMDGRAVADGILTDLEHRVAALVGRGVTPTLGVLLIGDDPRSAAYVRRKQRAAARIGVMVQLTQPEIGHLGGRHLTSVQPIFSTLEAWNGDDTVHGVIIQLPLPAELATHELALIERIDPAKDVDGLHPVNFGRLLRGYSAITPATPRGVMALLAAYGVDLVGQRVTLIGYGKLVGRALASLLVNAGATLTIATRRTRDLAATTRDAEVVISAAGSPNLVTSDMVSPEAVLVDVGLSEEDPASLDHTSPEASKWQNDLREGKRPLVGDISDEAKQKARLATPVPGGVGPMTVAMLLTNVVESAERFDNRRTTYDVRVKGIQV
jgi:methylenetetrahydrofolate dehydrogenase (NADP+)/methenyltetrahydrofolate cyclohydrolase